MNNVYKDAFLNYLKFLNGLADVIQSTAQVEQQTGRKISDLSTVWSSPQYVENLKKQLGNDTFLKYAILLLRLQNINKPNLFDLSYDEKMKLGDEMKSIVKDFQELLRLT